MPLDFEVRPAATRSRFVAWEVFDCASGAKRGHGLSTTHEAATLAALAHIAARTPGTVFVARTAGSWEVWHPVIRRWAPLALTTAADIETVRAFVVGSSMAAGKTVSIITSAV